MSNEDNDFVEYSRKNFEVIKKCAEIEVETGVCYSEKISVYESCSTRNAYIKRSGSTVLKKALSAGEKFVIQRCV